MEYSQLLQLINLDSYHAITLGFRDTCGGATQVFLIRLHPLYRIESDRTRVLRAFLDTAYQPREKRNKMRWTTEEVLSCDLEVNGSSVCEYF